MSNRVEIKEYNLYDFLNKFQEAIHKGYSMNTTMPDAPQQFGTIFYVGLTKEGKVDKGTVSSKQVEPVQVTEEGEVLQAPTDEATKSEPHAKRGRKPKE